MLTIVDLAGSERLSKSNSEGLRIEEAKTINKSISALGNCIAALAADKNKKNFMTPQSHVPYRDSKLTRLLTDSLGGNSKTGMCACIAPTLANYDETFSTLLFASRAMTIKTQPKINEDILFKVDRDGSENTNHSRIETLKLREELEMVKQQLNQHYFHQTLSSMSTMAKSNNHSTVLSRENSGNLMDGSLRSTMMDGSLRSTMMDGKMGMSRKDSDDLLGMKRGKSFEKTEKQEKYIKPFLLNLNSSFSNELEAQNASKREQELIKRYSGVVENLQQQLSKKNQKMTLLEDKLSKYIQLYGDIGQ